MKHQTPRRSPITKTKYQIKSNIVKFHQLCAHEVGSFCQRSSLTPVILTFLISTINSIPSIKEQNNYLSHLLTRKNSSNVTSQSHYRYRIETSDGNSLQLCFHSFCSVFGIGAKRGKSLRKICTNPSKTYISKRGGNRNPSQFNELTELIKTHISSFDSNPSHYCRNKQTTSIKYFDSTLSLAKLHKMFNETHISQATSWHYRKVFLEHFNIRFNKNRTDLCDDCFKFEKLSLINNNLPSLDIKNHTDHLERADKFYKILKTPSRSTEMSISFDMMQVLKLPYSKSSSSYFSSKISFNTLGIVHKEQSVERKSFYCWSEVLARKGPNEIASCLHHYINKIPDHINNIKLFSDSCPSQNKNATLISMLIMYSIQSKRTISYYFPEKGHSFIPPDRAFACVENRLKRMELCCERKDYESLYEGFGEKLTLCVDVDNKDWKKCFEKEFKKIKTIRISKIRNIEFSESEIVVYENYDKKNPVTCSLTKFKELIKTMSLENVQTPEIIDQTKKKSVMKLLIQFGKSEDDDTKSFYGIQP